MSHTLVKSCLDCKSICCKHGPGPHKKLTPEAYLENFSEVEAYNTKCMALTDDGKCSLWGTPNLPQECRVYVCQSKLFSQADLKAIANVHERECENCGCSWMLGKHDTKKAKWTDTCEACGYVQTWNHSVKKKGKVSMKNIDYEA